MTDDPIVQTMPAQCVQTKLSNLPGILSNLHGLCLLVGYKIEVVFFRWQAEDGAEPFINRQRCGYCCVRFISLYNLTSSTQQSIKLTLNHTLRRPPHRALLTGYVPLDAPFTILIVILNTAPPSTPPSPSSPSTSPARPPPQAPTKRVLTPQCLSLRRTTPTIR